MFFINKIIEIAAKNAESIVTQSCESELIAEVKIQILKSYEMKKGRPSDLFLNYWVVNFRLSRIDRW